MIIDLASSECVPVQVSALSGFGQDAMGTVLARLTKLDAGAPGGLVLTLENLAPIHLPTVKQICGAVDLLTPHAGPGFVILDSATQDYVRAVGGDGRLTAEWREYSDGEFKHWVAGLDNGANAETVEIETNDCIVTVHENEVVASEDVKSMLTAFALRQGKPVRYVWRDINVKVCLRSPEIFPLRI